MNLEYNFTVKTTEVTSAFKQAEEASDADIHIDKKFDWLRFEISFNPNSNLILDPKVLSTEYLNSKTIIRTNTLDILVTDVIVDEIPYFHKINVVSEKTYSKENFIIDLNIKDIVEFDNEFYTNSAIYAFNSETDYIYTTKVVDVKSLSYSLKTDCFVVEAPKNSYVKTRKNLFNPQIINPYSFYLPSFYIQKSDSSFISCIESDIKIFESKVNSFKGDYLKYKVNNSSIPGILNDFNISVRNVEDGQTLKYRLSTHCFSMSKDVEYFKIDSDGSIRKSSSADYLFKVDRIVDIEKIDVNINTYKELEPKSKNILGSYINSFQEVNKEINNFGTVYNRVYYPVFVYSYVAKEMGEGRSILFTPFNFESTSRLQVKSLKSDASLVRSLPLINTDNIDYSFFDDVNYFLKQEPES